MMTVALLKIECLADGWRLKPDTRRLAGILLGPLPCSRRWVAEITGWSARFGYERRFLKCKKDYSNAENVGNRGVYAYYLLYDGHYYEVSSPISWKSTDRFFCRVSDGEIVRISKQEVDEWLNGRSA